jgi:energy-coupling factor transporter ATP-binding protein EcfA2
LQQPTAAQSDDDYHEPITKIMGIPIKVKHTPARLAHDILVHNDLAKFTQISVVGLPGSGKTTFVKCLAHTLHTKDPTYKVYHFKKEQILKLDKILDKEIPKRQNCILVFDDISYLFEQLSEKEVANILHNLTIVREKLDPDKQTKAICILMFHYSFALIKGMRMSNFRVMCSIQDEEFENYRKILGYHNSKNIRDFVRKYLSMMRYRNFRIPSNTDEPFVYKTDQPFRLALISNLGELHYTLYHRAECALCSGHKKEKPVAPNTSFWDDLIKKYRYEQVWNVLTKYAWISTRAENAVYGDFARVWRHIEAEHKAGNLDLPTIIEIFKSAKKVRGSTPKETSEKRHAHVMSKLKEMEKALGDKNEQLQTDSLNNIESEKLEGDEDKLHFEESEFILKGDDEEDDDDLDDLLEDDS